MRKKIVIKENELANLLYKGINENLVIGGKSFGLWGNRDGQKYYKESDNYLRKYLQSGNLQDLAEAMNNRGMAYSNFASIKDQNKVSEMLKNDIIYQTINKWHVVNKNDLKNRTTTTNPQPTQQYATDWKTAEAEINQVVKGDFRNWPMKVKQAGWPDDKIQAYRQLASNPKTNPNGVRAWNQYRQQQRQPAVNTQNMDSGNPNIPNTNTPGVNDTVPQVTNETIRRIIRKYTR